MNALPLIGVAVPVAGSICRTMIVPVRLLLVIIPGRFDSTLSNKIASVKRTERKWFPGTPLGTIAAVSKTGVGRTGLPVRTLARNSSSVRIEVMFEVGRSSSPRM